MFREFLSVSVAALGLLAPHAWTTRVHAGEDCCPPKKVAPVQPREVIPGSPEPGAPAMPGEGERGALTDKVPGDPRNGALAGPDDVPPAPPRNGTLSNSGTLPPGVPQNLLPADPRANGGQRAYPGQLAPRSRPHYHVMYRVCEYEPWRIYRTFRSHALAHAVAEELEEDGYQVRIVHH
jgi:hypothetical protein